MTRYHLGHGPLIPDDFGAFPEYPPEYDDEPTEEDA